MSLGPNLGSCIDPSAPDDREALVNIDADGTVRRFTYGDVRHETALIASQLRETTSPGDVVGLLAGTHVDHFFAFLAVMQAGCVACPINWKLPADTIAHIVQDAAVKMVIADEDRRHLAPSGTPLFDLDDFLREGATDRVGDIYDPAVSDLACIMYTSGSTGKPKGVPISHKGYVWGLNCLSPHADAFRAARTLVAAPLYHMNAQCTLLMALSFGGSCVVLEKFNIDDFLSAIETHSVTDISGVPTMMALALKRLDEGLSVDLSTVAQISIGSAPMTESLFRRMRKRFPGAGIDNGYGTTEIGFIAFGAHPDPAQSTPDLSIGYPHPAIEARLIGPDAPDRGILHIKTGMMTSGYLNRPDATKEKFVDGWFITGDVMRRDENGFYFFVERDDDMFVCGGVNLFPGEIEELLERHPGVAQAAVAPAPHEIKGEVPFAFIVAAAGHTLTEQEVKNFALENGPAYAHPRRVFLVDSLPLSGANKIDRNQLRKRAREALAQ